MGDNRRIQVISAGYSKTEFIERLNAIFPEKNYKLYWRLDHWEIVADRPLTEEEKESLKSHYKNPTQPATTSTDDEYEVVVEMPVKQQAGGAV